MDNACIVKLNYWGKDCILTKYEGFSCAMKRPVAFSISHTFHYNFFPPTTSKCMGN